MQSGGVWGTLPRHQWVRWQSSPPLSVVAGTVSGEISIYPWSNRSHIWIALHFPRWPWTGGRAYQKKNGQQKSYTFPMGPFRGSGGYIALQAPGAGPDSPWGRLCGLMGREDMVSDGTAD